MSDTLVIVLTHGQVALSNTCLGSIYEHATADVLWVDNGSPVDEYPTEQPTRQLLLAENLGFPRAINLGLQYFLDGPWRYVVIQNNDTVIYDDVYATMRRVLDGGERRGICGTLSSSGWQDVAGTQALDAARRARFVACASHADRAALAREMFGDADARVVPGMVAYFCTMISRDCLEDVGLLDPGFGMGMGEDDDHCLRAIAAGWQVMLAQNAYVEHAHRATWKATIGHEGILALQSAAAQRLKVKHGV